MGIILQPSGYFSSDTEIVCQSAGKFLDDMWIVFQTSEKFQQDDSEIYCRSAGEFLGNLINCLTAVIKVSGVTPELFASRQESFWVT